MGSRSGSGGSGKGRAAGDTRNLAQVKGIWWLHYRGVRRSLRTASLQVARDARDREIERIDRLRLDVPRYTWRAAVARWLSEVAPHQYAPRTVERYRQSLAVADAILGGLHLDEITLRTLTQVASRRTRAGFAVQRQATAAKPIKNATLRRDLTAIGAVLRHAVAWGWLERDPSRDYDRRLIRERRQPIVLPDPAEVERFAEACPGPTLPWLVRLLRATGLRLEEAAGLQWQQVDRERRAVTLHRTKAGRIRAVELSPAALEILSRVPRRVGCPWIFWYERAGAADRYHHLAEYLLKVRLRAGVSWRTHDLRHLYAVEYLQQPQASIYRLQAQLGHGTIKVTEGYLDYLTPEEVARAKGFG